MRDNVKSGALTETTLFILLAVYQPNHGYGIMQFIENQTGGRLLLGAGTLYGALNNLLKKEWIEVYSEDKISRKKEYIITNMGEQVVAGEIKRIEQLYKTANKIVTGRDLL